MIVRNETKDYATEDTLLRLVIMTNQTCMVALDKTMAAISRSPASYAAGAARCGNIRDSICRAVTAVCQTLPANHRSSHV